MLATYNRRLLELVETLITARLEWLALELLEGVRTGHRLEEPEEVLASTRKSIRQRASPKKRDEWQPAETHVKPIPPEEQLEWAATYVEVRIDESLRQLQTSIAALDLVVQETTELSDMTIERGQQAVAPEPRVLVVLKTAEGESNIGDGDVVGALDTLAALRTALSKWAGRSPDRVSS